METVNLNKTSFFEFPEEWKKSPEFYKVPKKPTKYENYNCINTEIYKAFKSATNGLKKRFRSPYLLMIVSFFEIYDSLDKGLGDFLLENPTFTIKSDNVIIECPISKKNMTEGDKVVLLRYIDNNTCNYFLVSEGALRMYMDKNYTEGGSETSEFYLRTEQFYGEIILNSRWPKEIFELREKKDKFKEEVESSITYLQELLDKFNESLIEDFGLE